LLLAAAGDPHRETAQKVASESASQPPRAANPLSSRWQASPHRPQQHAVVVLRAEALRTCRAAQSLHASLRARRRELRCFCLLWISPRSLTSMLPPGHRLEGPPLRNGVYSCLPAIPVALIPNKPAPRLSARCCWDLEAQRHRPICQPRYHFHPPPPACIVAGTSLPSPPLTSYLMPSARPRQPSSRPQHAACKVYSERGLRY
jgi:hypothetical protein